MHPANSADWTNAQKILEGDLLSVILPVYNLGSSIAENLESVAACLDAGGYADAHTDTCGAGAAPRYGRRRDI